MKPGSTLPRPANAVVRQSSGEQAALYIRRLIFDGQLRPGSRVPQDDIAEVLGISRIPLREALIALEREGWVTIEMHRGAFINTLDAQAVSDHYELYGLVYAFAVPRALARGPADLVERLAALAREMAEATDFEEVSRLALSFHATVVDAARSPRVKVALRAMSSLVPGNFFELVPDAADIERKGLAAIVRALKRGDAERAADEYRRMMSRIGAKVVKLFKDRGLFASPVSH